MLEQVQLARAGVFQVSDESDLKTLKEPQLALIIKKAKKAGIGKRDRFRHPKEYIKEISPDTWVSNCQLCNTLFLYRMLLILINISFSYRIFRKISMDENTLLEHIRQQVQLAKAKVFRVLDESIIFTKLEYHAHGKKRNPRGIGSDEEVKLALIISSAKGNPWGIGSDKEVMLALVIASAKEAGRKISGGNKKSKKKKVTKLSCFGYKTPETEEVRAALCSIIVNGKKILRMTDPDFFYANLALNAAAFMLDKDATEEEISVFLLQTADHLKMLIPVSGRYSWNQVVFKKTSMRLK